MKHQKKGRKLGRTKDQRRALTRQLMVSLVIHGKIKTTEAKAKELKPLIEKIVSKTKRKDGFAALRTIQPRLNDEFAARKIFKNIAPNYKSRQGGYVRIVKLPPRERDGARMAIIEFI